jgi:hypothetical protein
VAAKVKELGLERPVPVQALPLIELDDVHLVCWLAMVPAAGR